MNLVQVNNGQLVASSRDIAKHFEKAHGDVLKSVDNLVRENSLTKKMFFEASREYRGQSFRYFLKNLVLYFEEQGTRAENFLDAFCKLYPADTDVSLTLIEEYALARHEELKAVERLHENGFSDREITAIVASM